MFGKFFKSNKKNTESEDKLICWIADFRFEIDKPSWWNDVTIQFDEEELAQSNNVNHFAAGLSNGSMQKAMKAHHAYNQVKKEMPHEFANIARSSGDPKLDLQITKGMLTYKMEVNPQEGEALNSFYFNMANALYELNEPELAKRYYAVAAVPVHQQGVDSYHDYIVKKAKEKVDYFNSFEDVQALKLHLLSFRSSIDKRASLLKDPEKLARVKEKLNGFMWTITLDELQSEQLALMELIYDDFQSGEGKIITSEIVGEVKQTLKDYHDVAETYFDINISGIFFPEGLSNKWELQFDGKEYEIVHVTFDRWQMTDVSLSD